MVLYWNTTSWGRPHTILFVAPWDVPYWRLEDVSCRCYVYLPIRSNIYLQGTCAADVLRKFLGNVLRTSPYGSISKTRKRPRDKDLWITCLKLNSKTYIFLSSKILSNSIDVSSMYFFNHNCLILQQNWLHIKRKNLCHQQWLLLFPFWITESEKF